MQRFICSLIFISLSSLSIIVQAQAAFMDSMVRIDEVEIVKNRKSHIIPAQKLDDKVLESLNSQSVADAIRYFSGVQIKDYGGIGGIKTVNIRSMGTNNMGVFYDGIQLGNAQNGQVDLGRYSLDNVEEISLYNGQKSDIFQSAKDFGSSGTIYIKTKRPHFATSETYHVTGQLRTGSFGLANPSFVWEQKITDYLHLSASAEYTYANGRYKFRYKRLKPNGDIAYDTTATRENSDIKAFRGEVGLFGYTHNGRWNLKGYFYNSSRGLPGAVVNNVFKHGERQWDRNIFVQGSYHTIISPRYQIQVNAKYANDYTHFLRDDKRELYVDNRYWQQEVYLSMANLIKMTSWWDISVSADVQWNKLNADMNNFAYPRRWNEMIALASSFSYKGLKAQMSVLGQFIQDDSKATAINDMSESKSEFSPAAFISWQPYKYRQFTLNAFFKRAFRMPTFNDMYYTEVGSTLLEPERTSQYSIGANWNKTMSHSFFDFLSIQANTYYNLVENKIVAYPTGQQFRWTMLNLGKVKIYGVEVAAQVAAHIERVKFNLRLNYTYQSARDFTDKSDTYYKHQIPYIPYHSGSVIGNITYRGWDLNCSFIYTGERYNAQENIPINYEQPWYTTDMSVGKDFKINKVACRIVGELNNVFNQYYDVVINFPMPGRNFKFILKVTI
ncbi:MAG: TonB-dependent receptor [Muribaculaceae bacterium]